MTKDTRGEMNILVVSEYFYPRLGGGEIVLWNVANTLLKRGHRIQVVTSRMANTVDHEIIGGIEVFRPFPSCKFVEQEGVYGFMSSIRRVLFFIKLGLYLRKFLRLYSPDIIYIISYPSVVSVSLAAQKNHPPIIMSIGSQQGKNLFQSHNPIMAVLIYLAEVAILHFGKQNGIRCASNELAQQLLRNTKAKAFVIPTPVDVEEIKGVRDKTDVKLTTQRLGIKDSDRFIVFVGRLDKIKNVDRLIRVLSKLDMDFKLVVVGDGPERGNLERMVSRLGLEDRVTLIGSRPHEECLSIMRSSEVLVLPSSSEVVPNVVIEALALGTPTIATRVGGVPEIQSPNLYKVDNIEEIEKLLRNGINRKQSDDILERYSLDKIVTEYETMFQELRQSKKSVEGLCNEK